MLVELHPEAERELAEAAAFLEERSTDLGAEFLAEAERVKQLVMEAPTRFPEVPSEPTARRAIFHRFRYHLVYVVEELRIFVVAFAHMSREPDYWKRRLPH